MIDFLLSIPSYVFIALIVFGVSMGTVAYLILLERKVAAWTQDRLGPNRAGPFGLLQPMADGLKFFVKEDYRPGGVDKWLFTIAPALMMAVVLIAIAVIPWGGIVKTDRYIIPLQIANLNIGVLFIVAVLSLSVYGVVVGGWASNNKYSFLGGLRATAQMISYEIPLGLSLLTIVVMFGTLDLGVIVERQSHLWLGFIPAWNVFTQPIAFILFLVCIHAEANRAPFDLAEAEQELVGGYHTEYSSMRFALFFLAEYAGMIATSAVCVALFFGGWHFPGLAGPDPKNPAVTTSLVIGLVRCAVYFIKVVAIIFIFMWVRWSLPRFRFDQLMMIAWRGMIPLSLAVLMATAVGMYFVGRYSDAYRDSGQLSIKAAALFLAINVVLMAGAMIISRLLPAPPETNRRLKIEGSRFTKTPLPAGGIG